MAGSNSRYTPEFRETAVNEVISRSRPITEVARQLGIAEQTLGDWVKKYRQTHVATGPELSLPERARLKELERENRELKQENEFLGKSVAFFAKKFR
jgi:transposase-like protein